MVTFKLLLMKDMDVDRTSCYFLWYMYLNDTMANIYVVPNQMFVGIMDIFTIANVSKYLLLNEY